MTIFLLFPFTRLVHVWSAPLSTLLVGIRLCARGDNFTLADSPSLSGHLQAMIVLQSQEKLMKPQVYHVDAFTSQPFRGILPVLFSPPIILAKRKCSLSPRIRSFGNCFSAAQRRQRCAIRYFTPTVEVPICGHATVAGTMYVRRC